MKQLIVNDIGFVIKLPGRMKGVGIARQNQKE
jgi:hypothetical protein